MNDQEIKEYADKPLRTFTVKYPAERTVTLTIRDNSSKMGLLENIFAQFNHGSMQECDYLLSNKMRSLSVHDFVKVDGEWFQCASVGWIPVTEEYVHEIEGAVTDCPEFEKLGAWKALQDLMWSTRRQIKQLSLCQK
jgi:hypothetical protein